MKTVGKFFAKKLASLLVLLLVLGIGIFWFRNSILAWFQGTHKVQYEFVIKKFEAESKLVVAGAEWIQLPTILLIIIICKNG
jgi:hypothetical protein